VEKYCTADLATDDNTEYAYCMLDTLGYRYTRSWDQASLMYSSITNKMQRYTMVFITINALHVSGGSSAHHQELKTIKASGICRAFTASCRLRE